VLFPTHLAAAGLLGQSRRLPTAWLVVGAAVPDLLDKPLALVGVVDLYHSVGHSVVLLLIAAPLALSSRLGLATAVGWGSHIALDALKAVVNGRPADLLSLAWPVTTQPDPLALPPLAFFSHYVGTPSFFLEGALWLGAAFAFLAGRSADSAWTRIR
jgi:hypothetical protein